MKHLLLALALIATLAATAAKRPDYKNPQLSVSQRVDDLLSRMTLEEKVGQTLCLLGWNCYAISPDRKSVTASDEFKQMVATQHIGMLWGTYRADPWTQKTLSNGLNPTLAAQAGNALQRYVIEHTRLGIPVFLAEEAPHGHMAIGTTVFPTGIGMAATFSPALAAEMGAVVGKEVRQQGAHISYGPVLDLAREPRWSRVEETCGEDPTLSGTIGAAIVRGTGAGILSLPYSTIATLKHFIGYGTTEGGQNGGPTYVGWRELHEAFLPPFKQAIQAGALSVMTSYNSIDGVPNSANAYLFGDLLRGQWGFKGFVVSDLYSIDGLYQTHHTATDEQDAGEQSLRAQCDVDLGGKCFAHLAESVRQGKISEDALNQAVRRVLTLKFEMGLFDHPYVDVKAAAEVRSQANKDVALRVARAAVTLLENKHNTLPLDKSLRVAVVGPNADNCYNMLGDYTAPQEDGNVRTVLQGIRDKIGASHVVYAKGCAVRDTTATDIAAAVEAAQSADVVVAVVGGSSARDFKTSYKATGAAETDPAAISDMECGEGYDRATLGLLGDQDRLLESLKATGKPLVVVYIEGRPLLKNWAAQNADALLTAYYPGQEGGNAIADVLFGDYNPAGRLPFSVPRSVGQLPVHYNRMQPSPHRYVESEATPLYSFGYGLSYTSFAYSNLTVQPADNGAYTATLTVTNTGKRDGDEVVQLYLHDNQASVVRPVKQLCAFERVHIPAGEQRQLTLTIPAEALQLTLPTLKSVTEPGTFEVQAGASSTDIRLSTTLTVQ